MTAYVGRHARPFGFSARRYDADPIRRPYTGRHRTPPVNPPRPQGD